jgi:hypothetical protein
MPVAEIRKRLHLDDIKDRPVHIEGTVATTGEGIYEGLDWICEQTKGGVNTNFVAEKEPEKTLLEKWLEVFRG